MTDVTDEPYALEENAPRTPWEIRIHLANGTKIATTRFFPQDFEDEDVSQWITSLLTQPRPCWITIENATFFTQAVSAVEVESL